MAKAPQNYSSPRTTALTELWYSTDGTAAAVQVFGVQGIPRLTAPPEDITYQTLESDEEFGAPGIKAFEAIEITLLYYKEQHAALKALDGDELHWYVKLPGSDGIILHWRGTMSYILEGQELSDMLKSVIKIGKSTTVEEVSSIPGQAT